MEEFIQDEIVALRAGIEELVNDCPFAELMNEEAEAVAKYLRHLKRLEGKGE